MTTKPRAVAFIPARSGSKRVPNKNVRPLADHPMIAYSIRAAIDSGVFDAVICATDSEIYADIARHYGAEVPFLRAAEISTDKSPDIEWVVWMLEQLRVEGREFDIFSILRPTSPFRLPETIQRAWQHFTADPRADSLRAIEKCKQHPGKMWIIRENRMLPLMPFSIGATPWHSSQYAALPEVYAQDASLEIAWSRVPLESNSIAGESIIPFVSQGYEGFDINEPDDWWMAERLLATQSAVLPNISINPYNLLNRPE
ncbi:acylneuraminate cytidylyltransferase family protein [Rhizobium ruizarguesonis]|uniref:acylneuraminate cytidylyltransferase family protein n=1 Tax=Rhizobium ruizarguesonis TaxID=2081791 RepID=UPI001031871A|nr:acylneuraminate cytidylyltransferase family protein [Rhizobium ruizarguesonis]TAY92206.1 acylneuraminate cytidylyltransferase family protein [Rhizobium ruizarguesonis]TBA24819.1 acylneuraminate cytidylyltransferase family protein [Rhizobium ruizarguesonis]TBA41313.1 acylneuraminate cytidylyltransferase family protein [Rhizobium ruizarguesonis]TBA46585.1 acylneuraminate cytidylyltransferase family protein [Rhizobium ruizarguesonis]TBB91035.1 acylneuraminate cytidylyltransferase family protei